MSFRTVASIPNFGGTLLKLAHDAKSTGCEMKVNVFLPPQAKDSKVPVLFYLSGLTCTPENCTEKGFFQAHAADKGIAVVYPDTSPRGIGLPGEDDSYDFGSGAGFYVNATKDPWSKNYNMYDYIVNELPESLFKEFGEKLDDSRVSITGHSMGGHGALTVFLKNPGKYKSVSAFAPISNPINAPWGQKAFEGYLNSKDEWADYDASELIKKYSGPSPDILIDVGTGDNFYKQKQLLPENLLDAAKDSPEYKGKVNVRFQPDYDHSYFFISSFAKDHVDHAAKYLFA